VQETTETTIDLRELFLILLGGIKWIVIASLFGTLVAFALTWWLIAPKYTSSVSLYVNNTAESAQIAGAVNINDLNASQRLVNTYIVILQDDEVLEQVANRLTTEYTLSSLQSILPFAETPEGMVLRPATLRDVITLSAVNNTEVMRIEATTKNAELSARICTIMTEVAPPMLQRVVKAGSVEVIGEAKVASAPSSPNLLMNLAIGFLAGFAVSVAALLLVNLLDNRVADEDEVKKRFNIPILGTVPDFDVEANRKGGGYRYAADKKEKSQ
jgi:capsular polysaccharide biosynthesis protein